MPIKKLLGLTIAFLLCMGMAGIGTWAYSFSDTETSTGNVMAAGTMDLKTNDVDGVTQTLYATNMQPGGSVSGNVTLKNSGTTNGSTLNLAFSYLESDSSPNPLNMSANATAAQMKVTTLNYGGSDLLASVSDSNTNGYDDVQDLKTANLTGLSGINPSATEDFSITVQLEASTNGDFQADGITVAITFTLNQ